MRVLIVEDSPVAASALEEILRQEGHCAEAVDTAEEALGRLPLFRPDVALIDLCLPGMNGLELLRLIREREALRGLPGLPAVMQTAATGPEADRMAADLPALAPARLLPKPADAREILAALRELTEGRS